MQPDYLRRAIEVAARGVDDGHGGPFGAVVVRAGQVVGEGCNQVTGSLDPTAHAEIVAIRAACQTLGSFSLAGSELYSSCEPCPMCLSAIYWARLDRLHFAATRADAAEIGFDDELLYAEVCLSPELRRLPSTQRLRDEARRMMLPWKAAPAARRY